MATTQANTAAAHDLELVALSAAGSPAAFGELVRRHGGAVRGLLRSMGANGALADDLAQDAFLAAYEQIAEFRGDGAFQAWVEADRRAPLCEALAQGRPNRSYGRASGARRRGRSGASAGSTAASTSIRRSVRCRRPSDSACLCVMARDFPMGRRRWP